MPRPPKWRRVGFIPEVTFFKPAGIPLAHLEEIRLSVEEAEAIRLKDLEGLEQEECAQKMLISRPSLYHALPSTGCSDQPGRSWQMLCLMAKRYGSKGVTSRWRFAALNVVRMARNGMFPLRR